MRPKCPERCFIVTPRVFSRELLGLMRRQRPGDEVLDSIRSKQSLDKNSRRQYADVKNYLPDDILTKVDRTSMLVSLEARNPLLDHKLAEFAARIPANLKARNRTLKYVLKSLALRYLPRELIDRPKMGFAIPIRSWINNEWHDLSHELVLSERALGRHNVNPKYPAAGIFRTPKRQTGQHRFYLGVDGA